MKKTVFVFVVCAVATAMAQNYKKITDLLSSSPGDGTVARRYVADDGSVFLYRWHEPSVRSPGKKFPLVVLLHGAGERGTNNVSQLVWGALPVFNYMKKRGEEFFFVAGQVPGRSQWVDVPWTSADHRMPGKPSAAMARLIGLLARLRETEKAIDLDRIYVTGISMGGYGTWDLISRKPEWFAAAMPVCGGGDVRQAVRLRDMPVFIHHGDTDGAVPVWRARSMIAALRDAGSCVARYTEYPGCGHGSWHPAYGDEKNLEWMFSKKRPARVEWRSVDLSEAGCPAPDGCFDVRFDFSVDAGATWRKGLVRRTHGFPLLLADDRVSTAPGYVFSVNNDKTWSLKAPRGCKTLFRNVAMRPMPHLSR